MKTPSRSLSYEQIINAASEPIYQAFSNATLLREFMCQIATVNPKVGGRIYLAWDNDYYAAGVFTKLEENRSIGFTWQGPGEPGQTQVEINLVPGGNSTRIEITHSGLGEGEAWDSAAKAWEKGWTDCLENLASTMETGEDLRITNRPMVGILFGEFNENIARKLGVPVNEGVRLGGVLDGLSAQMVGLQKDDVVVELDSNKVTDWGSLGPILSKKRGGDKVDVVYYRGEERKQVTMQLAKRPLPDIPWTVAGLASEVKKRNLAAVNALKGFLSGVSEKEAACKPAPDEWSIMEVLSHLLLGERYTHTYVLEVVGKQERWSDDYAGQEELMFKAFLATYPTLQELMGALEQAYNMTDIMVAALPVDFPLNRKGSYWRLAFNWLQPDYHIQDHLGQMAACLKAAREN